MDKEKVIQLAKDSGLIFNTELMQSELYPHHRKALYNFVTLMQREIQEKIAEKFEDEDCKVKILAKI